MKYTFGVMFLNINYLNWHYKIGILTLGIIILAILWIWKRSKNKHKIN